MKRLSSPTQIVKLTFPHYQTAGLQTHLLSKCCVHKKLPALVFSQKHVLKRWSVEEGQISLSALKLCIGGLRETAFSLTIYLYVCMYVYIYIYIYIYLHTHIHTQIDIYIYIYTHIHTHTYIHKYIHAHVCVF